MDFISIEISVVISREGLDFVKCHRHGLKMNQNITVKSAFRHGQCAWRDKLKTSKKKKKRGTKM